MFTLNNLPLSLVSISLPHDQNRDVYHGIFHFSTMSIMGKIIKHLYIIMQSDIKKWTITIKHHIINYFRAHATGRRGHLVMVDFAFSLVKSLYNSVTIKCNVLKLHVSCSDICGVY